MIYLIDVVNKIYKGWQQCWHNFGNWKLLLKYKYDPYLTWEFFSYMNNEFKEPYIIYLNIDDYEKLMEMIESPPEVSEGLKKILERESPWEQTK